MLTQKESVVLINLKKWLTESQTISLTPGSNFAYDLDSSDPSEKFILDLWRGTIRLKARYQTRARKSIILVRLDLNGAPHTNPNGQIIDCPHMHIYKEGFDDKWAYSLPKSFSDPSDISVAFRDFCNYCNIRTPNFENVLF